MAKKFEFSNNNLELDILGNIYELDVTDPETLRRILNFADEAKVKGEELETREDYVDALEETIQFCLDTIDSILGEGESKKIFKGQKVSLFNALDVINYIVTEVKDHNNQKFKAYSPNRAQRRAKK